MRKIGEPYPVGTRVRAYGEQYPSAVRDGTANVVEIVKQHRDGTWEYLVVDDQGRTHAWNLCRPAVNQPADNR